MVGGGVACKWGDDNMMTIVHEEWNAQKLGARSMPNVHLFMIPTPPLGLRHLLAHHADLTSIHIKDKGDWGDEDGEHGQEETGPLKSHVMKHGCDEQWHHCTDF